MDNKTKNQIYFYFVLLISILWLLFLPKPLKNFAPIIFVVPTFPFFMFNYYNKLLDFSQELKNIYPELFKKYVTDYGSAFKGKIVEIGLISRINDFENLNDISLREKYILCKQSIILALISFIIFPILAIGTIYL